jgi:hypothetical protein
MAEPMSAAAAAAVTAAAKAATFPTTLLLMFFITPPANGPKIESESFWTLQSTSQVQAENPEMCTKLAWDMINEVKPVRTLTVRAYCLCPAGNGTDLCFNAEEAKKQADKAITSNEQSEAPRPTTIRIGPKSLAPGASLRIGGPAR